MISRHRLMPCKNQNRGSRAWPLDRPCKSGFIDPKKTFPSLSPVPQPTVAQEITFEPLLDSEDAARLLRIHPKTLQKMARNGEIQAVKIGKLWRFRASHLNAWINTRICNSDKRCCTTPQNSCSIVHDPAA
ncbi:MAG: hypothetical protein DMG65_05230 [Candidatus Angelobacter sp. Gp1-AA117]|nr:MAG: hypothetical protein DMG65_05230 [Candidatus Angelobacter sp. Gp1-AA117]